MSNSGAKTKRESHLLHLAGRAFHRVSSSLVLVKLEGQNDVVSVAGTGGPVGEYF